MKTEWTAERTTLALIIPSKHKGVVKEIFALADKRDNGYVTVRISNVHRPRSTGYGSQNHHLNGHIQQLAEYTGHHFEVVKLEVKNIAIGMGYPMLVIDGNVKMDIHGRPMGISESDASVEECTILIEAVHQLAAEIGYTLREE